MMTRTLIAATALALLLIPVTSAHSGAGTASSTNGQATCSGSIDFLCTHIDCDNLACIRFTCVVYLGHSGHVASFGCTPP